LVISVACVDVENFGIERLAQPLSILSDQRNSL
jgi:hypothetical protein